MPMQFLAICLDDICPNLYNLTDRLSTTFVTNTTSKSVLKPTKESFNKPCGRQSYSFPR